VRPDLEDVKTQPGVGSPRSVTRGGQVAASARRVRGATL